MYGQSADTALSNAGKGNGFSVDNIIVTLAKRVMRCSWAIWFPWVIAKTMVNPESLFDLMDEAKHFNEMCDCLNNHSRDKQCSGSSPLKIQEGGLWRGFPKSQTC